MSKRPYLSGALLVLERGRHLSGVVLSFATKKRRQNTLDKASARKLVLEYFAELIEQYDGEGLFSIEGELYSERDCKLLDRARLRLVNNLRILSER